jgi:TonB family protein
VLRFKSPHDPWTAEKFDRAFQNSLQPRGHLQLPPGATNPPPGSDTRIAYILDGAPVYRPGGGVTAPRQIRRSDPTYTDSARRARAGGTVLLRFIVNEDGSVSNLTTAQPPLGFGLDEQAARMADRWQFSPATLEGQPVKADIRAETSFCLY